MKQLLNSVLVGYEELSRLRFVLSNICLNNSSYPTPPHSTIGYYLIPASERAYIERSAGQVQSVLRPLCPSIADTSVINYNRKHNLSTDPPENVRLMLTRSGQSATITCTAEARPKPSFKIFFNCDKLVQTDQTYTIPEVNRSHVGVYKCVAVNILGQRSAASKYFSLGNIM